MKILIINHNGGSPYHGPNLRTYYAAKSLVSRGHEVSIVSSTYSHKFSRLPPSSKIVNQELIDGINYYWIRIFHYRNLISRVVSHFLFGVRLIFHRRKLPESADVVLFSGPPPEVFLFSAYFAKKINAKICCDVRDMWPITQIQMNHLQLLNPYTWFLFLCECFMYYHSEKIVSPLQGISLYKSSQRFKDKVRVIPNGYEDGTNVNSRPPMLVVSSAHNQAALKPGQLVDLKKIRDQFFVIGYSGSIDRDNDTESLVDAALQIDDPSIIFVFVGDGVMKSKLINKSKKLGNTLFFDKVISNQVPEVLKNMDAVYCGLKDKSIYRYGVSPAKIYEYMASAKPIIWSVNASNNPIEEARCGVTVRPGNLEELVSAICKLKNMPAKDLADMGLKGRAHFEKTYNYKVLGDKWQAVFQEIVKQ